MKDDMFLFVISPLVPQIFRFSFYANWIHVTDVITSSQGKKRINS